MAAMAAKALLAGAAAWAALNALPAQAARVVAVTPQGEVTEVRQVVLRFDSPVVPAGNPRAPAPAVLTCEGGPAVTGVGNAGGAGGAGGAGSASSVGGTSSAGTTGTPGAAVTAGSGRWADAQRWLFDLQAPLPSATRCTLKIAPGFTPLGGPLEGATEWRFATGAPRVVDVQPYAGAEIEEDQHFLLQFNGPADAAGAVRRAWCEVEDLGERVPVRVVTGAARDAVLRTLGRQAAPAQHLLLACQRPLPAQARVRLVWGPSAAVKDTQRFEWTVRARFAAEFSCERENAQAPCLPLRPMRVQFNAPVPRAQALALRLQPASGAAIAPQAPADAGAATVDSVVFAAPLPESTRFQLLLPPDLKDETGRALSNAGSFPLAVATGGMPPLAKFAGAPFGILEAPLKAGEPALLPITLRLVQADLQGASTGGQVRVRTLDARTPDLELLRWLARVERFHETELDAREAGLPQTQWTEAVQVQDARGVTRTVQRPRQVQTRSVSLLAQDSAARAVALPQPAEVTTAATATATATTAATATAATTAGSASKTASSPATATRPTEVIGLPLTTRGYHVVEVESRLLGQALLANRAPMYVRTGVLVTPIAVHFKRGRSSSLAWVTTLERARPVASARVTVNDCRGQVLWSGSTGPDGTVRIDRGFDDDSAKCLTQQGLFVTARAGQGDQQDLAFVFSRWNKGIEPWRFNIPTAQGSAPTRQAHSVLDRSLLRVGETVSMKHFVRIETEGGLALPAVDTLPDQVVVTHQGSGAETLLPLAWPRGARSAESAWAIPKTAALGSYDISLQRGDQRLPSGSLRVEAFRVPLLDARLTAPAGDAVAPAEVLLAAQINAMSGGPMTALPLQLSALLRPAPPSFAQHPDFSFNAPRSARQRDGEDDGSPADDAVLVANKLQARTDAQGAARLTVASLPALPGPAELTAELSFDDPNGEVQTLTQTVKLWPAALLVGLRAPGWAGSRGSARFTALVVDTRGKPLPGRAVEVLGRLHQATSTRTRIVGGFYAYDTQRSVRELGLLCQGQSDAQGRLNCDVETQATGEIELVARTKDDAGRQAESATTVWVTGAGELWFEQDNDDRIDVLPEQRELAPGQTARLQVRMPFRSATALVTVEREGVMDARVVQLSGRNPVIELPIDAAWAPNVHVGVLVLRGRLREAPWWSLFTWGWREPGAWWQAFRHEGKEYRAPTALVDLAKPTFKFGMASLSVGRAAQQLDVTVTADRPADTAYAVRETVKATVRVLHAGKPVANTEVAFAAVDEGLLALMSNTSWNLLDAMVATRAWGVETATAQGELIGRRHYGRKALPPGGGGGRNPTRELFDTLLLWQGSVALDAKGEARIDVPLNDSLTRFRLVAIADDGGAGGTGGTGSISRFGTGSTTVRVSQDLQMLSGLAPLARQGDRVDAAFTLRNTTARAMAVSVTLAGLAQGDSPGPMSAVSAVSAMPAMPALPTQTVQLAAGAAQDLKWTVTVPEGAARIDWTAEATETGSAATPARDRLKITQAIVPVVPQRVWQASLQQLDPAAALRLPVAPPTGALPGRSQLLATLKPSLASGGLPGVQRYFENYPYTCLEQQASRAIGLRNTSAWQALGGELPAYLDSDGLAGYFPPQPGEAARGSDTLTAYLLSAAHEAGWSWPQAAQDQMLAGLAAFVEGRIQRRFNAPRADLEVRKLAALEALSRHGRATPRMLGSINMAPAAMGTWPTSALLDTWRVLDRLDKAPERTAGLADVQRLLRTRLIEGGSTLAFSTEAQDDWWWLMEGGDANAARLLLAALATPAWKDDVPRLLTGLLGRQQRGAWRTTTANVWGSLAVERFAKAFETSPPTGQTVLALNGKTVMQDWAVGAAAPATSPAMTTASASGIGATAASATAPTTAPATAAPATAAGGSLPLPLVAGDFTARHNGTGRPWLSLQTLAAVPLKAPMAAGYRISRSVSAVQRKVPDAWSRGDVLRVRVEIDALGDMAWVVLSDPVPTGATLLGSGLGRDSALATRGEQRSGSAWLAYEERANETWRSYWEWLPRGRHVVEYSVRLNASGRFGLPPTRVEAMYAPDSFGETPNAVLEVRP